MNFSTVVIQKCIIVIEQNGNTDVGQGMQLPCVPWERQARWKNEGMDIVYSDSIWLSIWRLDAYLPNPYKPVAFLLSLTNFRFVSMILTYQFLKQFVSCDNLNRLKILVYHDFFMLILSQPWIWTVPSGSFRIINILKYKISWMSNSVRWNSL